MRFFAYFLLVAFVCGCVLCYINDVKIDAGGHIISAAMEDNAIDKSELHSRSLGCIFMAVLFLVFGWLIYSDFGNGGPYEDLGPK